MLFLPVKRSAGSQGLRAKNTLFEEERRKGRFFTKQPEGLDLDGQAERANFATFFEVLKHHFFLSQISQITRIFSSTGLP